MFRGVGGVQLLGQRQHALEVPERAWHAPGERQAQDTGPAIVGEADAWKATAIVMGLPYKRRFGEFNLGKTAPYVLKNASCRVILFRERLDA